jgi:hypothetical protein
VKNNDDPNDMTFLLFRIQLTVGHMMVGETGWRMKKDLKGELNSLAIECKRMNELNDEEELEALTIAIKEVYFQDYKTAYNNDTTSSNTEIIDQSHSHYYHLI